MKSQDESGNHLKCVNRSKIEQGKANELLPTLMKTALAKVDQATERRSHRRFNTAFYASNENVAFSKFMLGIEIVCVRPSKGLDPIYDIKTLVASAKRTRVLDLKKCNRAVKL